MNVETSQAPVESTAEAPKAEASAPAQPVRGPAHDLREIQNLLLGGIFPGNVAPAVITAYKLLDDMAKRIEDDAQAGK